MANFPVVPDDLLKALEKAFPDKLPRGVPDQAAVGVLVGQQKVLDLLRVHHSKQNPMDDRS